jgi:hypothetical protein
MPRLAIILLTCLSLLRPDLSALASCHEAAESQGACCATKCDCRDRAGDAEACCCDGEPAPRTPTDHPPAAPTSPSDGLERALCTPDPILVAITVVAPPGALAAPAPSAPRHAISGRRLLLRACRLRH